MAIGAGLNALGSIGRGIFGGKQQKLANKINPQWSQYTTSPFAKQQLATAQNAYNARMAGAAGMEQNIYNSQASTQSNINRNARSSAQALALAGGLQGQTNDAFGNLAIQEAQNKTNLLGNLNQGYQALVSEGDKEYQSKLEKYKMDLQQQAALRGAGVNNMFGAVNDIAGLLGTLGQGQQQNQFWRNLFGGGNNATVPMRTRIPIERQTTISRR